MMTTFEMNLKPWAAPSYAIIMRPSARREEGFRELPSIHVSELTAEALTGLAEQWLVELYGKAGRAPNWTFHKPA